VRVDIPVVGDVAYTLEDMLRIWKSKSPQLDKAAHKAWWKQIDQWRAKKSLSYKKARDTIMPPPPDTIDTLPRLPEKVAVAGRVLGIVFMTPGPGVRDTVRLDPVVGAKVTIMRNILVNGRSAQELAAALTTDASGRFTVTVKGGYYVVYAEPPAGSIWSKSYSYLPATQPNVNVDVYLWKRGDG